jgi:hypothetical protein
MEKYYIALSLREVGAGRGSYSSFFPGCAIMRLARRPVGCGQTQSEVSYFGRRRVWIERNWF